MYIYEPKGKALEYSPLAINLYSGCNHGCLYCYMPKISFKSLDDFKTINLRNIDFNKLEKELKSLDGQKQVLFSFSTDPYNESEILNPQMPKILNLFLKYKIPVAILTKAGTKILRDLDIFKKFGDSIKIGATLTFLSDDKSKYWESGASLPNDRLKMLEILKENRINTWASFEPVIEPQESLNLIKKCLDIDCVDEFRVGKLNNYKGIDKNVDWEHFLQSVLNLLRPSKKKIFIKYDLRENAKNIFLSDDEKNPFLNLAKPFKKDTLF